jgi:hypothetical protein
MRVTIADSTSRKRETPHLGPHRPTIREQFMMCSLVSNRLGVEASYGGGGGIGFPIVKGGLSQF